MNGEFLAKRRIELGLSQGKVAETLGYSTQTISLWEKGKGTPSLPVWGKLASLYQLDLEGLLLDKESKASDICDSKEFNVASFGTFLRYLRKRQGLTQAELAKQLNVPNNAIIRYEQGSSFPGVEEFKALAALFNISFDELYFAIKPTFTTQPEDASSSPTPKRKMLLRDKIIIAGVSVIVIIALIIGITLGINSQRKHSENPPNEENSLSIDSKNEESISNPASSSFTSVSLNSDSSSISVDSSSSTIETSESSSSSIESIESNASSSSSNEIQSSSLEQPEESSSSEIITSASSSIEESTSSSSFSSPSSSSSPVLYLVSFDLNGGTSASYQGAIETESLDSCLFYDVEKPGYDFKGWIINNIWVIDENGNYLVDYALSSSITLTAKYEAIAYPIYYELDGGTNNEDNPSTVTVNDTIILQNPSKSGFNFLAWYSDEAKEAPITSIIGSDLIEEGSITIYAKFEYNKLDPVNYPYLEFSKLNGNKASVKKGSSSLSSGTLTIPDKITLDGVECDVTEIEDNAFSNTAITGISLPKNIERIGDNAFSGCNGVTAIIVHSYSEEEIQIGERAFANCTNLALVYLYYPVLSIGDDAFINNSDNLIIMFQGDFDIDELGNQWNGDHKPVVPYSLGPGTITEQNVTYVKVGFGETQYYLVAKAENSLTSVNVLSSVYDIPVVGITHYAFYGKSISSITLPDSTMFIGEYAFAYCSSLASIHIPENVDTILDYAFLGDYSLTIYCEANSQPYGWSYLWNPSSRPVYWGQ